jgi:TATA-binding protein-associated factor
VRLPLVRNENSLLNICYILRARLVATNDQEAPKSRLGSPAPASGVSSDKVVIDPSKGGAVLAKSVPQSKALDVPSGLWIWDGVVKLLEVDLFSPAWEVRHGAAMALRELLKVQGYSGGMRGKHVSSHIYSRSSHYFHRW